MQPPRDSGRITTDGMSERDRLAFWHDVICTHLYHVSTETWVDPATFDWIWDVRDCADFGLADVISRNRSRIRGASEIARDSFDVIAVQQCLGSPVTMTFASDSMLLQPGDLAIFAMDWRHRVTGAQGIGLRSFEVPRAALSPLLAGGSLRRPMKLGGDTPLGSLLGAGLEAAWTQSPRLAEPMAEAVLRNLIGLVALSCGASASGEQSGREGVQAVRLDAARAHVTRHLADPALSPASTAAALGVSVRYLHRLFEPTGESFAHYVTRQRLECCRDALRGPDGAARSVADIAFGWGFNSLPTFYRAFAAAYGMAPGDARRREAAPCPAQP